MKAINRVNLASSVLLVLTTSVCWQSALAEECIPEGVESSWTAATMPAEFPASIPLPEKYFLMSAAYTPADEYNPYPNATVELLADGSKDEVFAFLEKNLPTSGYRIVMWEKDEGATGFRVRGEGIDQATIAVNDYDCRGYLLVNVSLLP
jgi:hypothetical protein